MYGLFFILAEEWVIEKYSLKRWHTIKEKAGCSVKDYAFLRRSCYPDRLFSDLVHAACEVLDVTVDEALENFGQYMVKPLLSDSYGMALLQSQGSTLRQWLSNLNAMHDHVKKFFPAKDFKAPVFWCEDCDEVEGAILLHYYSLRGTLFVPLVVGIVKEVATVLFGIEVTMQRQSLQNENGASFTTWKITADDERSRNQLSASSNGQDLTSAADLFGFDSENIIPNKCPFTQKELTQDLEVIPSKFENSSEVHEKCPFTGRTRSMSETLYTVPSKLHDNSEAAEKCPFTGKARSMSETFNTVQVQCSETDVSSFSEEDCQQIGISLQKMQEVFPFHVLVERDFSIVQVGNTLPTMLGRSTEDFVGRHIQEFLEISRPIIESGWDWKALSKLADQQFYMIPKQGPASQLLHKRVSMEESCIKFKGSMILISSEKIMFALSPAVNDVADLKNMGLTISDLPLHNFQRDAVFLGDCISQEVKTAHDLDKLSRKLAAEKDLSNTLLHSILPEQVANDLRAGKTVEPTFYENVTLFFSDIVGFTDICDRVDPWDVIDLLNQLYGVMDFLAAHFKLYKVETIGDAYMCCSGLPEPDEYHAERVANFALAAIECVKHIKSPVDGSPLNLRMGIHTGNCVAGVVGSLTPHYCLFGNMVNQTSRHESTGLPGKIHCSSILYGRLQHFSMFGETQQYNFTPRGLIEMKGVGDCFTYWLDSGTEHNRAAGPKALKALSQHVEDMLVKNNYKMKRYLPRSRSETNLNAIASSDSSKNGTREDSVNEEIHEIPSFVEKKKKKTDGWGRWSDFSLEEAGSEKTTIEHLIDLNVEILERHLKRVIISHTKLNFVDLLGEESVEAGLIPIDEFQMIISMRQAEQEKMQFSEDFKAEVYDISKDFHDYYKEDLYAYSKEDIYDYSKGELNDCSKGERYDYSKGELHDYFLSNAPDHLTGKEHIQGSIPLNEVQSSISVKEEKSDKKGFISEANMEFSEDIRRELHEYVTAIAASYEANEFHNFEHATRVAMLADLFVKKMEEVEGSDGENWVVSDPLACFAVVLSALVHDTGHTGVPNVQLAKEVPELASKYNHRSIAEQNSIDIAWDLLLENRFATLQYNLFDSPGERERFRQLLVNCVMATDIFDKELKVSRNTRWEKAFDESTIDGYCTHYRATILIEHIIQASDVAHTMQAWETYREWNERLFCEMYTAFMEGRAEKDPSENWYSGELWFFDNWVHPLARKIQECGIFGILGDELLYHAYENRQRWEAEGEYVFKAMLQKASEKCLSDPKLQGRIKNRGTLPMSSSAKECERIAADLNPGNKVSLLLATFFSAEQASVIIAALMVFVPFLVIVLAH